MFAISVPPPVECVSLAKEVRMGCPCLASFAGEEDGAVPDAESAFGFLALLVDLRDRPSLDIIGA